ncbi:hypothetical protein [Metabacillus bambusae]|nr:hypothetical protein [Metabacillus bambusae]
MVNKKVVVYEIKSNSRSLHDDLIKNIKKKNDDVINQAISYVQSN